MIDSLHLHLNVYKGTMAHSPGPKRRNGRLMNKDRLTKEHKAETGHFLISTLKRFYDSISNLTSRKVVATPYVKERKNSYKLKALNFFKILILTLRAIKILISHTQFRPLSELDEYHYSIIDDLTHFSNHSEETEVHRGLRFRSLYKKFMGQGCMKKIFRLIKKKFKLFYRFFLKIIGIFHFSSIVTTIHHISSLSQQIESHYRDPHSYDQTEPKNKINLGFGDNFHNSNLLPNNPNAVEFRFLLR